MPDPTRAERYAERAIREWVRRLDEQGTTIDADAIFQNAYSLGAKHAVNPADLNRAGLDEWERVTNGRPRHPMVSDEQAQRERVVRAQLAEELDDLLEEAQRVKDGRRVAQRKITRQHITQDKAELEREEEARRELTLFAQNRRDAR